VVLERNWHKHAPKDELEDDCGSQRSKVTVTSHNIDYAITMYICLSTFVCKMYVYCVNKVSG